jgi:hypothetical protein
LGLKTDTIVFDLKLGFSPEGEDQSKDVSKLDYNRADLSSLKLDYNRADLSSLKLDYNCADLSSLKLDYNL